MLLIATPLLGLIRSAQAEPPSLSAAVQTTVGAGDEEIGTSSLGHDVRMGWLLTERLLIEGISASSGGRFEVRSGVRWFFSEPWTTSGALALTLSGGIASDTTVIQTAGVSYDFPLRQRLLGRVGVEVIAHDALALSGVRATLGLTLPPRETDVIIETVYIERPTEPEVIVEEPPADVIWIPDPICDWMPASEAAQLLLDIERARLTEDTSTTAAAAAEPAADPSIASASAAAKPDAADTLAVSESAEAAAEPPIDEEALGSALASAAQAGELPFWSPEVSRQGSLIVLAHPGDRVQIDGEEVAVDETGLARVNRDEGPVTIEVYSGGQQQQLRAALVPNHAVWVRAKDPDPTAVFFKLNSSELSRSAAADIQAVATYAASWSFVLQGGYSPEGSLERNRQLAIDRARSVSRALQDAGISTERIVYLDPPPPDPNRPPEEQRNCQIIPVAPGGEG